MAIARVRIATDQLTASDRSLRRLHTTHGYPTFGRPVPVADRFATVARSIVFQQLAGRAAATIHGRFLDTLGGEATPATVLAASRADLRAAGLSEAKTAAILDLAHHAASGSLELDRLHRLDDATVIDQLSAVRGIGRWTAEMFLIFSLGRLDVWPTGDLGVRNGFSTTWLGSQPVTAKEIEPMADRFRPFRSIVAWYCWRAADGARPVPRQDRMPARSSTQ